MKRIFVLINILLFVLSVDLYPRSFDNDFLISGYVSAGYSFPGGTFNSNYDVKSKYDSAYSYGVSVAWAPASYGALAFSTEYSSKKLSTDYTYNGAKYSETMDASFINFMLGWKGFASYLYYEAGLMYSLPYGTWKNSAESGGSQVAPVIGPEGNIKNDYLNPEYGAYFGLGGVYWINDSIAAEAGLQFQGAFNDGYRNTDNTDDNKLRSRAVLLKAGVTYCL